MTLWYQGMTTIDIDHLNAFVRKRDNEREKDIGRKKGEGSTWPICPSNSDCSLNDRLTAKTYVGAIR